MQLKPPLTYDEQIKKLKEEHNLKIYNYEFAIKILKKVNYYRLSGYGIGLKKSNNKEHYKDYVNIEYLFNLYNFDRQFKNTLIRIIEEIEIELRTQIAYYLSIKYGSDVLMKENNFIHKINKDGQTIYSTIIENLKKEIHRQKNTPFVNHHIKKYNGNFPIWVTVELMSFGKLSSLFSILKNIDQKNIAKYYNTTPKYLKNWILCLVEIRNICAHYMRLYNMPLKVNPKLYKENKKYKKNQNKIFPVLLIIKRMLNSNEQWDYLLKDIKTTFKTYNKILDIKKMNFPENWEEVLWI